MCTRLQDPPPEDVVSTQKPYGGSFGPVQFERNVIAMRVDPEMLGIRPTLSPEQERQREADRAERQRKAELRERADVDMLAALRAKGDVTIDAMLDLHERTSDTYPVCGGEDFAGYDAEPGDWPCLTVLALAKAHGVPTREDVR